MNAETAYLIGIASSGAIALLVVGILRKGLTNILADLCGGEARGRFWVVMSSLVLALVPIIFAMTVQPDASRGVSLFYQVCTQVKWALAGLVATLCILACVIGGFILHAEAGYHPEPR